MADKPLEVGFDIHVPEQGIILSGLSAAQAEEWVDRELATLREMQKLLNQIPNFNGQSIGSPNLAQSYINLLESLRKTQNPEGWKGYLDDARNLHLIVWQGYLGNSIRTLRDQGKEHELRWLAQIYSLRFGAHETHQPLAGFRALGIGTPLARAGVNIKSAEVARETAEQSMRRVEEGMLRFEKWEQDARERTDRLHTVYEDKLALEFPGRLWKQVAETQGRVWKLWLGVFGAFTVLPLLLIYWHRHDFVASVLSLTTNVNAPAGLSLSGVAALTIPALFYAWFLKNISRLFVQALNTANDAQHRRAMALTYLALAKNKRLEMKEAERALILNALFRPGAAQNLDEGPPIGLLDLIRSK